MTSDSDPPIYFETIERCAAVSNVGGTRCELVAGHDDLLHRNGSQSWNYDANGRVILQSGFGTYELELSSEETSTIGPVTIPFRTED